MKLLTAVCLLALGTACMVYAAADAKAGKDVYDRSCRVCHGDEGQGNPAVAKAMNVTMPDLRSKAVQGKSDAALSEVVEKGSGKMRPVSGLSKSQVADVVAYVRTLGKK